VAGTGLRSAGEVAAERGLEATIVGEELLDLGLFEQPLAELGHRIDGVGLFEEFEQTIGERCLVGILDENQRFVANERAQEFAGGHDAGRMLPGSGSGANANRPVFSRFEAVRVACSVRHVALAENPSFARQAAVDAGGERREEALVVADIETTLREALRQVVKTHRFRLPITIATVAANGSALLTRFTAPAADAAPGSVEQEHVGGHIDDEGFLAPLRMLVTDATGRAKLAVARPTGDLVVLDLATD
jgi:hypothetical protein